MELLSAPEIRRRIQIAGGSGDLIYPWWRPARRPRYLAKVVVDNASRSVALGSPYQLSVRGIASDGSDMVPRALSFRSLDTTVAQVDTAGIVTGHKTGLVRIAVSAGGWRETEVPLEIVKESVVSLFAETWEQSLREPWFSFGDPTPQVITGPGGKRGMWNAGDGKFHSGVYLDRPFDATKGLALRAEVSTPVHMDQWQVLQVALYFALNPVLVRQWNSHTGYLTNEGRLGANVPTCSVTYPGLEGPGSRDSLSLASTSGTQRLRALPAVPSGAWYTLVVQIFPDGRCGFAINGKPLWIAPPALSRRDSTYLALFGNSYHTKMLVGHLTITSGVLPGIPWDRYANGHADTTDRRGPRN